MPTGKLCYGNGRYYYADDDGNYKSIGPIRGYELDSYIKNRRGLSSIVKVIFNEPATIIFYIDKFGEEQKVVVKCSKDDDYDPEKGLAMALSKILLGDDFHKTFKLWLPEEEKEEKSYGEKLAEEIIKMCF